MVAVSTGGYLEILSYLENNISHNNLETKLPCDFPMELLNEYELVHGNSAYIINVQEVLRQTCLKGFAVEVIDSVIDENCGIFSLSGEKINKSASLSIKNGYLAQWLFGFKNIAQLIKEGHAECADVSIIEYMDSLTLMPCYCLDEY